MSIYGMVFGRNAAGPIILATLGLTEFDVGRYRDCFVAEGEIAVYTRNGGGNRDHWNDDQEPGPGCDCTGCIATYRLPAHPLYLRDQDDDFDCTYATFYFRFPEEYAAELAQFDSGEPFQPSERWLAFINALKQG